MNYHIAMQDRLFFAHPAILNTMQPLIERRLMSLIHFHVIQNDVGYLPDSQPAVFDAVDEAIEAALDDAETHMDAMSQQPDGEIIRGQEYATTPVTFGMEISNVQAQVDEIRENLRTNEEYTTAVAQNGLLIVLEDGARVIEISPCVDDCLEGDQSHVENW